MKFYVTVGNDKVNDIKENVFKTLDEAYDYALNDIRFVLCENGLTKAGIDNLINGFKLTNKLRVGFNWWTMWIGV